MDEGFKEFLRLRQITEGEYNSGLLDAKAALVTAYQSSQGIFHFPFFSFLTLLTII